MQELVEPIECPAYVVLADPELTIKAWNRLIARALRYTLEEAIGRAAIERLRPVIGRRARTARVNGMVRSDWWNGPTVLLDRDDHPVAFDNGVCCPLVRDDQKYYLTVLHPAQTPQMGLLAPRPRYAILNPGDNSFIQIAGRKPRRFGEYASLANLQGGGSVVGFSPEMSVTRPRKKTTAADKDAADKDAVRRRLRERKTFALRFRLARDERRFTQAQMGEFLGVRVQEINRYEQSHRWGRPPSNQTRAEFATKLGKPRDWFATEFEIDERLEKLTAEEEASL